MEGFRKILPKYFPDDGGDDLFAVVSSAFHLPRIARLISRGSLNTQGRGTYLLYEIDRGHVDRGLERQGQSLRMLAQTLFYLEQRRVC